MARKKPTLSSLDEKLWRLYSRHRRYKESSHEGYVVCYTCGAQVHWKKANLGHYISRAYKAVKYHPDNTRMQCVRCNKYMNGEPVAFRENLVDEIGEEEVRKIEEARHEIQKQDRQWFEEQIEYYKRQNKKDMI